MEQYFVTAHIPKGDKVNIASIYMSGDKLWWQTRVEDGCSPEIIHLGAIDAGDERPILITH